MFCPKCAAQNVEGASFCRVCGANISMVPQALSGEMQETTENSGLCLPGSKRRKGSKEIGLDNAVRSAFMGLGFLFVAIALSFSAMGTGWWFWMLIPAFSMMGTGVAQFIRFKEQQRRGVPPVRPFQTSMQSQPRVTAFPRRNTGELVPPPASVTEGTTRHLGVEAATRHLDEPHEVNK